MTSVVHFLTTVLILTNYVAAFVIGPAQIPHIGSSAQYRSADRRSAPVNTNFGIGSVGKNFPYGAPPQGFGPVPPAGAAAPCPMSPYATFLNVQQQEALHELVTEARRSGASEVAVREHMDRYIREILPSDQFARFQQASVQFEAARRGKRSPRDVDSLKDDPYLKEQIHVRKPRKSRQVQKKEKGNFPRKSW